MAFLRKTSSAPVSGSMARVSELRVYVIRFPSGVQAGDDSGSDVRVNRYRPPVVTFSTQTSPDATTA